MCELKLLVSAPLAAAVIGKGGLTVRRLKSESGATSIHVSHNVAGVVDRTVGLTGEEDAICKAYTLVAEVLRAEAGRIGDITALNTLRILVPDAESLAGPSALRRLQTTSGAQIGESAAKSSGSAAERAAKERLVTCTGSTDQTERAAHLMARAIASRSHQRHKGFLSQWAFETNYNDHFETPAAAYAHILPLLHAIACQRDHQRASHKRKRADSALDTDAVEGAASAGDASVGASLLRQLTVYDPYYCQGRVRDALVALGMEGDRVLNSNRDFCECWGLDPRAR